jgi:putative transposase
MILARNPTDLADTEWAVLAPLVPAAKAGGRPRTTDMREMVNGYLPYPA